MNSSEGIGERNRCSRLAGKKTSGGPQDSPNKHARVRLHAGLSRTAFHPRAIANYGHYSSGQPLAATSNWREQILLTLVSDLSADQRLSLLQAFVRYLGLIRLLCERWN
jgi:hypothetical protein